MKRSLFLFLCFCVAAGAQNTRGYAFFAPGKVSAAGASLRTYHLGGGVERLFEHGIGAAAELGALIPGTRPADNTVGILSLNAYYLFVRERKLEPFVTAGYSLLFRDFSANMFNFGGGLNYWFEDNLGVRLEFRDHIRSLSRLPTAHYWGVRIGLTFR